MSPAHARQAEHRRRAAVKHGVRLPAFLVLGHIAAHTAWYSFEHAAHAAGFDPKAIAHLASGPAAVPVGLGLMLGFTLLERRLEA